MTELEGVSIAAPPRHFVTCETEVVDHWITDDQLMILARGGKDKSFDVCVAAFSLAIGFSQNAYAVLADVLNARVPSVPNLLAAFLFIAALTAGLFALWSHWTTKKDTDALVTRIRSRSPSLLPNPSIDASAGSAERVA